MPLKMQQWGFNGVKESTEGFPEVEAKAEISKIVNRVRVLKSQGKKKEKDWASQMKIEGHLNP